MKDITNNLKKFNRRQIQLTIAINFLSSKDTDKKRVVHSNNDNIEKMTYDKADEVIEECFESVLKRYQFGLETLMNGSDFILDCVELLY